MNQTGQNMNSGSGDNSGQNMNQGMNNSSGFGGAQVNPQMQGSNSNQFQANFQQGGGNQANNGNQNSNMNANAHSSFSPQGQGQPVQGVNPQPGFSPQAMGMNGYNPAGMGNPMQQQMGGMPMPKQEEVDDEPYTFGELIAKHQIKITVPPHPSTSFDESKFLKLLAGSISLTKDEKRKIVESVARLSQKQIDDLMDILTDEKAKFMELSAKHKTQLKKLEKQHYDEWVDLEIKYEQENRAKKDEEEADRIRKQLGL